MTGEVKSFSTRHYGFITSGGVDYLFTYKDWPFRLSPVKGFKVTFDAMKTEKGLRATNIRKEK